eukprot:3477649-Amphidinium_carterae.1
MEQVCWITDRLRPDVGAESTHPHRALEDDVTNLAKELRPMPTIPLGKSMAELERGEAWPSIFCGFKGCAWHEDDGDEDDLVKHLIAQHQDKMRAAIDRLLTNETKRMSYLS